MQPLSDTRKNNFERFKEFMENNIKQKEDLALKKIKSIGINMDKAEIPSIDSINELLDYIEDLQEGFTKKIKVFLENVNSNDFNMKQAVRGLEEGKFTEINFEVTKGFEHILGLIKNDERQKEKRLQSDKLQLLNKEILELEGRQLFTQRKDKIIKHLKQLKRAEKYKQCNDYIQTAGITRQGNKIISKHLTPILKDTLEKEIDNLGAKHLLLNLKSSGSGGETKHKIQLQENQFNKVKLSDVLSEGEQRIVALAGFFAELELGNHECPIVFDDPVSSLDHRYREKIAYRLARESMKRQVIVFTHDISLLLALEKHSGKLNTYFHPQTLNRNGGIIGNVKEGNPWHAMTVKKRIGYLKKELNSIKKYYQTKIEIYNEKAANLYGLLRETWETLIEEELFNETIYRHSAEIQTQRLKSVEIRTEDYKIIDTSMAKCSKWMIGHDKSTALDINRPNSDEILEDILQLDDFRKSVVKRREDVKKEREAALSPKKPPVG